MKPHPLFLLLPFTTLSVAFAAISSPLGPVVSVGYANFIGNTTSPAGVANGPVTFFGDIPYAQPPLGDLRFRAPKPLDESKQSKKLTDNRNWGPACVQIPAVVGIGSEDCLTLNIWKPTNATAQSKLPVVVYIHGGGFYYGTPQGFPMYDWVAQHSGGIIGVSITYRLGIFGFLGGPSVASDGALNAGLLDQRAALEWVQRHISAFGGDPNNVTISGESAGGASVIMQLVAYGGTKPPPFNRAIAQSIGYGPTLNQSRVNDVFSTVLSITGCAGDGKSVSCLRKSSLGTLISAANRVGAKGFAPIIDGSSGFLPDLPARLIAQNKFTVVDVLAGHCTGDGHTFAGGKPEQFVTDDDIRRLVFARWPGVSSDTITQALALYPAPGTPGSEFATQYERATELAGDIIFTCMDYLIAEQALQRGAKNVYAYSWDAPDAVLFNANPYLATMHTSDLYFLFSGTNTFGNAGNTFTAFNKSEAILSAEAIGYWTSFAAAGSPSSSATVPLAVAPVWQPFASTPHGETRSSLRFNRGSDVATASKMENITETHMERCRFWMSDAVISQTGI